MHSRFDTDNNIAAHAAVPTNLENLQSFGTEKELAKAAAEWPGTRLIEIWNSFAGLAPFDELKPVTAQGRDAGRDHGNDGLAGSHGSGLREHSRQ
jgi:hypothetical protein